MVPKEAESDSGFVFISGNARTAANQGRIRKHSQRQSRILAGLPTSSTGLYGNTFPIQGRRRSQRYKEEVEDEEEDRAFKRYGLVPLDTQNPPSEGASTRGVPVEEERAPSPVHDLVKYSRDPFSALPFEVDDLDFQLFYDFCNTRHTDFRVHPSLAQVYDWDLDKRLFTSGANAFSALFLSSSHYAASSGGLVITDKIKSHEARTAHFLSAQSDPRPNLSQKEQFLALLMLAVTFERFGERTKARLAAHAIRRLIRSSTLTRGGDWDVVQRALLRNCQIPGPFSPFSNEELQEVPILKHDLNTVAHFLLRIRELGGKQCTDSYRARVPARCSSFQFGTPARQILIALVDTDVPLESGYFLHYSRLTINMMLSFAFCNMAMAGTDSEQFVRALSLEIHNRRLSSYTTADALASLIWIVSSYHEYLNIESQWLVHQYMLAIKCLSAARLTEMSNFLVSFLALDGSCLDFELRNKELADEAFPSSKSSSLSTPGSDLTESRTGTSSVTDNGLSELSEERISAGTRFEIPQEKLRDYLSYYAQCMWSSRPSQGAAARFMTTWGTLALRSEVLLRSFVAAAARRQVLMASATGYGEQHELVYKTQVLGLIRKRLASGTYSMSLLVAIATVATSDAVDGGDQQGALAHLRAIEQIVRLKGGMARIPRQTQERILASDVVTAASALCSPILDLPEVPELKQYVDSKLVEQRHSCLATALLAPPLTMVLSSSTIGIIEALRDLTLFSALSPRREHLATYDTAWLFCFERTAIAHRLLGHMSYYERGGRLDYCLHLAFLLYIHLVLQTTIPRRSPMILNLVAALQASVHETCGLDERIHRSSAFVWIFLMGAFATSDAEVKRQFTTRLGTLLQDMAIWTYGAFRRLMQTTLHMDTMDDKLASIYQEACSHSVVSK